LKKKKERKEKKEEKKEKNLAKCHLEKPSVVLKLGEVCEVEGGHVVLHGNSD
jgi:hypothetical protein